MTTLTINTSRFGSIEVEEANILHFCSPILGFEHLKKFVLLDHAENSPFKWLQSVEDADLAFVITNPKFFAIPYEFVLPEDAVEKLSVSTADDVLVFTIVNIPNDNPVLMTANLLAPLVLNQKNLQAMQVVLQDPQFSTRTRLLPDTPAQSSDSAETTSVEQGRGK